MKWHLGEDFEGSKYKYTHMSPINLEMHVLAPPEMEGLWEVAGGRDEAPTIRRGAYTPVLVTVSGAGTAACNGVYVPDGSEDGVARYRLPGTPMTMNRSRNVWYLCRVSREHSHVAATPLLRH